MKNLSKAKKLIKTKEKYSKLASNFLKVFLNDFSKEIKNIFSTTEDEAKNVRTTKKLGRKPKKQKELNADEPQ